MKRLGLSEEKVYYLASPYSHRDPDRMHKRFEAIDAVATWLIREGAMLIEPISMCHSKSLTHELPGGYEYWQRRDRKFVSMCDGIIITKLEGWDKSVGMADELQYAASLGKDIHTINVTDMPEDLIDELYGIYEADRDAEGNE